MGGVPCIRGLRIPVATVVGMVADGMTEKEILDAYPDLEAADIAEALRFAAEAVRERVHKPVGDAGVRRSLLDVVRSLPVGNRTREDIDRQIEEERSSWNER